MNNNKHTEGKSNNWFEQNIRFGNWFRERKLNPFTSSYKETYLQFLKENPNEPDLNNFTPQQPTVEQQPIDTYALGYDTLKPILGTVSLPDVENFQRGFAANTVDKELEHKLLKTNQAWDCDKAVLSELQWKLTDREKQLDILKPLNKELKDNLERIIDRIEENDLQSNFPSAYQRAKQVIELLKQ